ncbi:MAG TPA: LEA type 2 family protein [Vulgatibacter sp.]|nr:LEA type 2 family protein [Vulgatibacter sp.]
MSRRDPGAASQAGGRRPAAADAAARAGAIRRRAPAARRLLLLALPFVLLGTSGCALWRMIAGETRPELTFKEVRFAGWSMEKVDLELVYVLDNPWDVPLRLAEVAYQLEIEGRRVIAGAPEAGLRIEPRRRQVLSFPAEVRFLDVIPTARALFSKDALAYRASGRLGVKTPVGVVALPISRTGHIDVPKLPSLDLSTISVSRRGVAGASLAVGLDVTNRNAFPVPITGLDWALQLAGARVGGGKAAGAIVPPGATRRIEIPVDVNLASAGQGLAALLAGRPADVALSGRLGLGKVEAPIDVRKRLSPR